jgi:lipooligosaccharide transport system ATP-binding protein
MFLDEPTTGLDPQARHLIWDRLKKLTASGKTVVLTTHFMDEAERLCHRLAVIDHGRMVTEGAPRELIAAEVEPQVIELYGDSHEAVRAFADAQAGLAGRTEVSGETAFFYCRDAAPLIAALAGSPELRYVHRPANLEDVFLKLTGRELRD